MAWLKQDNRAGDAPATPAPDELPTDREVKSTVVHRLRENLYTQDYRIKVSVHDGVVVLGGRVGSPIVKSVAGDDAREVPGVRDVANELQISAAA